MKRISKIERKTKETDIKISLNLDGSGESTIKTPVGFLNHMMELFTRHGLFDIKISAEADLIIDEHHLVEDVGIVLGQAFDKAWGEKKGIKRYGFFILPMDETVVTTAVDLSGRFSFVNKFSFNRDKVGDLSTELVYDFWSAFAQNAGINLYIKTENSRNDHHQIEAIFKCVAGSLSAAVQIESRLQNKILSTKGIL